MQVYTVGGAIDRELNFYMHVSKVVNKASRIFGLVRATLTCIDETTPQAIHHYGTPSFEIWKCDLESRVPM